jgi:hypothetical protein
MSKSHPHAVTTAIISHDLPVNNTPYDPDETILDMPAVYHLSKAILEDPESCPAQRIKASEMMTLLEIKAKEMGIDLNQKGRVKKVKRSEYKRNFKVSKLEVSPLDVALLHKTHI